MFLLNVPCAILPIYLCYVGPENKPPLRNCTKGTSYASRMLLKVLRLLPSSDIPLLPLS